MCGRLTLTALPQMCADFMAGLKFPRIEPRYNIAPTQPVLCVTGRDGEAACDHFSWGLIPSWEHDPSKARRHFNARSETAAEKPSFRDAFEKRRCVILADGFYEWMTEGKSKLPYHMTHFEKRLLWIAGLWEPGDDQTGLGQTCTILTTTANDLMTPLHHRMPVILPEHHVATWLQRDTNTGQLQTLLKPSPENLLKLRPVSQWVNKASNDGPECLNDPPPRQHSFF